MLYDSWVISVHAKEDLVFFGSGLGHLVPRKLYEKTKNPYSSSEMKDSEMGFTQKDASLLLL